jgi:5-amino-6-(5-phosphoribosylamino)uracil reductase/diaminohydroxyphosphoribosylaminopyrimidine deaminase/5-amino-6-(5-phosphoribosylamino)uracil reductase
VILGAARARRSYAQIVAGHVTQTLDGRIACENGQSQWIGNAADLHHAHRMRALLDGVMVGANTALQDDPQLDVRHVSGPDPRRVVISGRARALTEGADLKVMRAPGCEVFVASEAAIADADDTVNVHRIPTAGSALDPVAVLQHLRDGDICSVYLEGGAGVLSSFLQAGAIDILQIHIASMVLGSGLPSLELPAVDHVDDGLHLHMDHAILDDHVLLTCRPRV